MTLDLNSDQPSAQPQLIGILLVNLGTPQAPTPPALRRYLREFLWDPRVVEFPRPLWWLILNGVILNLRPRKSAAAYAKIWQPEGSPLLIYSRALVGRIKSILEATWGNQIQVALAMRYGEPSVASALETLRNRGIDRLLVLPLYPQYSATTTGSVFDAVADALKYWRRVPAVHFINHYQDDPGYIAAMARHIHKYWQEYGREEHLLLSFHGVPKRYIRAGDPYLVHCQETVQALARALSLREDEWTLGFQSRFGREEWLKPYVAGLLKDWPRQGIRNIDIFCPGFAVDCLETLEEIAIRNKELFLRSGGERYTYIPALNDDPAHAQALASLIERSFCAWSRAEPAE